jgi:hypothetical protein
MGHNSYAIELILSGRTLRERTVIRMFNGILCIALYCLKPIEIKSFHGRSMYAVIVIGVNSADIVSMRKADSKVRKGSCCSTREQNARQCSHPCHLDHFQRFASEVNHPAFLVAGLVGKLVFTALVVGVIDDCYLLSRGQREPGAPPASLAGCCHVAVIQPASEG